MADEPTGALDSNTGKQVFDTLKKLSETKLVIVVSHDREFAEQYADRIIELKDGKILSDISKTEQAKQEINDNISVVGEMIVVTLFVFGPLSVAILVLVALLTTILATFIPVRRAAKKKPVDSIRTV